MISSSSGELPWQMPLAMDSVQLEFQRPLELAGRDGATPETSLRGAVFAALVATGCQQDGACAATPTGHPCQQRNSCPVGWLYQPRCLHQRRDHPSPLALRVASVSPTAWRVHLTLWGRRAIECREHIVAACERAGRLGIGGRHGAVPFRCEWQAPHGTTLAEQCKERPPARARWVFASPCQSHARSLAELAANTAHDLVQWELVDAGLSADLGKRGCDERADGVRAEVTAALQGVDCRWLDRHEVDLGKRGSRSNRGRFDLKGCTGTALLSGQIGPAWPWLRLLALRGAGGRRGFGLGQVRLEPWPEQQAAPG